MRLLKNVLPLLLGAVGLILARPALAAPPIVAAWESADFHAVVSGTSTLHDWSVESRKATGEILCSATGATGSLRLPANSLAGGPSGLNGRMYTALNVEQHPMIAFEAIEAPVPELAPGIAAPAAWPVRGRLTVAGVTREMTIACRTALVGSGRLVLEADIELKLTDFGIKPPGFMGFVRTGDAVKVRIRWELRPRAETAAD